MFHSTKKHSSTTDVLLSEHWAKMPSSYRIVCTMCTLFMFLSIFSDCWILTRTHTHSLVPHAYSRICVCLTEERIRMRSALAWIELNETRSLALCGTFTAAESIRDGRPQQKQQLLCVWATIRVMCRHFWNNRFSYQWDWCRYSLDWWCARAAFKNGSK